MSTALQHLLSWFTHGIPTRLDQITSSFLPDIEDVIETCTDQLDPAVVQSIRENCEWIRKVTRFVLASYDAYGSFIRQQPKWSTGPVSLRMYLDVVLAVARTEQGDVRVEDIQYSENVPEIIYTDGAKVMFMAFALIDNAINAVKGMQRDEKRVITKVNVTPAELVLCVSDNGCGFNKDEVDEFMRLGVSRFNSSGLGLPIVQKLSALGGGTLDLNGTPGQGAVVTLVLPLESSVDVTVRPAN